MGYLSRRRGVISVFLLMIFMITYVFMGLLVDAGRYRMAQTYMEASLDGASSSVLSSYNKLIFDLYGLFSTDIELAEGESMDTKIKELYNSYLEETLGIVDVDTEAYKTLLNKVLDAGEEEADSLLTTKSLYDFQITELNAGTDITLANTANVESQIIEYMKFRAPVELMGEVEGFINILDTITQMEDSVAAAQERREITKRYENDTYSVSKTANNVLLQVDTWMANIKTATASSSGNTARNLYQHIANFESIYNTAFNEYFQIVRDATVAFLNDSVEELKKLQNYLGGMSQDIKIYDWYGINRDAWFVDDIELDELTVDGDISVNDYINTSAIMYLLAEVTTVVENWIDSLEGVEGQEEFVAELTGYLENLTLIMFEYYDEIEQPQIDYENAKAEAETELGIIRQKEETLGTLYQQAYEGETSIIKQLEDVNAKYTQYISELEVKRDAATTAATEKAAYETEIQQIKSNAVLIIERLEMLKSVKTYLKCSGVSVDGSNLLSVVAEAKANTIIENAEDSDSGTVASLCSEFGFQRNRCTNAFNNAKNGTFALPYAPDADELLKAVQKSFCTLFDTANKYKSVGHQETGSEEVEEAKNKKIDTDAVQQAVKEKADEENGEEAEQEPLVDDSFKAEMLTVDYETVNSEDTGYTLQNCSIGTTEELDEKVFDKLLAAAGSLISKLGDMFEGARDNLYVDAYIMSHFPNYYSHYQKRDEETFKDDKLVSGVYKDYNASLAEVEYIITGGGGNTEEWETTPADFGTDSVDAFKGKLFGFRLMMNALSMFTDPGRYSQAMSISAWAGVFAPLVACVLMIAWTVAETALDVLVLTGDGSWIDGNDCVPVFKGSSQWYISAGGVLEALVNAGIDAVASNLVSGAEALTTSVESEVNAMIYDVYAKINEGTVQTVDAAVNMVEEKGNAVLSDWTAKLEENIDGAMGNSELDSTVKAAVSGKIDDAKSKLGSQFTTTLSTGRDSIVNTVEDVTGEVKTQAVLAVSNLRDTVMTEAKTAINGVANQASSFVSENISKIIPTGGTEVANCSVELSYEHHLYLFLFLMDTETKIQRIQSVVQANMQVGGQTGFLLEQAPVSVWADMECSIKYMFMSNGLVPENMRKDGRLRLKVISAQSY